MTFVFCFGGTKDPNMEEDYIVLRGIVMHIKSIRLLGSTTKSQVAVKEFEGKLP